MRKLHYPLMITVLAAVLAVVFGAPAGATPTPVNGVVNERVFNDCVGSNLVTTNTYAFNSLGAIIFDETNLLCAGGLNLHVWTFSQDGATPLEFANNSVFYFNALVTLSGSGNGEGGLRLSPWWSPLVDGRFMINAASGEIAVFGGRLPFYSFTAGHGISYVKGQTVNMAMTYIPNGLSAASPATIQYQITIGINTYSSGWINFDEGNPAEGHGSWGMLTPAFAGGYAQHPGTGGDVKTEFAHICFTNLDAVPTMNSTWGRLKSLYR